MSPWSVPIGTCKMSSLSAVAPPTATAQPTTSKSPSFRVSSPSSTARCGWRRTGRGTRRGLGLGARAREEEEIPGLEAPELEATDSGLEKNRNRVLGERLEAGLGISPQP